MEDIVLVVLCYKNGWDFYVGGILWELNCLCLIIIEEEKFEERFRMLIIGGYYLFGFFRLLFWIFCY